MATLSKVQIPTLIVLIWHTKSSYLKCWVFLKDILYVDLSLFYNYFIKHDRD